MSLRRGAQPRCLSFGFAFDYELFRLIVRELLSSFSHSALHRVASSLSLSLDSSFFPFSLSLWPIRVRSRLCGVASSHPTRVPLPRSSILRNHPHQGGRRPTLPSVCRSAHPSEVALFFAISCFSSPATLRLESAGNTDAHRI